MSAAQINTQLGLAYMQRGDLKGAMSALKKALAENPDLAEAQMSIAVLYQRLGENDNARRHYVRAVQLAPDDPPTLNNYGLFLCSPGEPAKSEQYFERAAKNPLYRTPQVPLTNAGVCSIKQGKKDQAEKYFLRALKADPRFPAALLHMAELRYRSGNYLSARGYYQRYLAVAPPNAELLGVAIKVERKLGDQNAVASYSLLLKSKYPDSEETRQLLKMEKNGQSD